MILAFTGAGISKDSGIPTFEDMQKDCKPGEMDIRDKLERTWATAHPKEYQETIDSMVKAFDGKEPNDAHKALVEYKIPIMTMNIDGLHEKAGSEHVVNMHGTLPNIVLYGDPAPNYQKAYDWVDLLRPGDLLMIIGTSYYTAVSMQLRTLALVNGAGIMEINKDASHDVRAGLEKYKDRIESFEDFMKRVEK